MSTAFRRAIRRSFAVLAALSMLVAACGDDDDDTGSTATTATDDSAGGGSDEGSTDSGEGDEPDSEASGEPIKIVLLWEVGGESDVGVDDFQNGAELAIEAVNAAGGIDGRPIEAVRIAANPLDPQNTNQALAAARDEDPTAMVGLIVNSQAAAAISQIDQAEVPLIMVAQADDTVIHGGPSGSDWLWAAQPYSPAVAAVTIDHLVEVEGYSKIGLLGTNDGFGQTLIDASVDALAGHDLEPFASRTYPANATDLTEQVLAMDGADVAVNWAYPNPLAVQLQQFAQNGIAIETYDGPSAPIVVQYGMAPPEALETMHATLPCNAGAPESSEMEDFVAAYTEAYGVGPSFSAVSAHDAVRFALAAIDAADSDDPAAVNDAIPGTELTGACGDYRADDAHVLFHSAVVVDYAGDGSSTNAASYELADTPAAG